MNKKLGIAAMISYITIILSNVLGLLFVPFMLKHLGDTEYGLYVLIGSLVSYLTLLDFGFGNAVIRYLAKYKAHNDIQSTDKFLYTSRSFYRLASVACSFIALIVYFFIPNILSDSFTNNEVNLAKNLFLVLIINIIISLQINFYQAIVSSHERFIYQKSLLLIKAVSRYILLFILLSLNYKSMSIVVIDTALNLFYMLSLVFYINQKLKIRIKKDRIDMKMMANVFNYTFYIFIAMLVGELYWQSGSILLGINSSPQSITIFNLGSQFARYLISIVMVISSLFLPKITRLVFQNVSSFDLTKEMLKVGKYIMFFLLLIFIGFIFFGRQFIELWIGPNYNNVYYLALIMMTPFVLELSQTIGVTILQAMSLHKSRSIALLITTLLAILSSIILIPSLDYYAPAISLSVSSIIYLVLLNIIYVKSASLNMKFYYIEMFKYSFVLVIFLIAVGILLSGVDIYSWYDLFFVVGGYSISYILFFVIVKTSWTQKKAIFYRIVKKNI